MGVNQAPTEQGKKAARGFQKAAEENERDTERDMGAPLKKGEERARSSDGKSAGAKQR